MKRLLFIVSLFCAICYTSRAADTIIVHKDARLDMFTEKQVSINKVTSRMTSNGLFKGYRLQVMNTRSRGDAFKIKADLLEKSSNSVSAASLHQATESLAFET